MGEPEEAAGQGESAGDSGLAGVEREAMLVEAALGLDAENLPTLALLPAGASLPAGFARLAASAGAVSGCG
ncbi:hypothetical protein [Streptomyces altiplanensis]